MRHTLFISDIHLEPQRPDITAGFEYFLKTQAVNADALYILGDLFEAWIGDDAQSAFTRQIQGALAELKIPVYLMRGNRDFLLGQAFARETNCELLTDPYKIKLYGQDIILSHGDMLCTLDKKHQRFRKYAHNPQYNRFFLMLPLQFRLWLARKIRHASRNHTRNTAYTIMDVTAEAVDQLMQQHQVKLLIHGHTHRPAIHALNSDHYRIVLGDWDKQVSALKFYENGSYELLALELASPS